MANSFLDVSRNAILRHGKVCHYLRFSAGVYDVETGTKTDTTQTIQIYSYKKPIQANQYNYPNLIGKESAIFYISYDAFSFEPSVRDKIVYDGETFTINSIVAHVAKGQNVLYKVLGVKG